MIVDSHVHLWDPTGGPFHVPYPWLTEELGPLHRPFDLADLEHVLDHHRSVTATVLVQASDSMAETDALLSAAAAAQRPCTVVGWLPLAEPAHTRQELHRLAGHDNLVGVRHLIHDDPDPTFLLRPAVAEALDLVAATGLAFDVVAERPDLLALVPTLARRHPNLTLVLDHLGKPPLGHPGYSRWADQLAAAADETNVHAKISGLATISPDHRTAPSWQHAVDHALTVFGPGRLLVGSDWPISLQGLDYQQVWTQTLHTLTKLTTAEQAAVLGATASRIYRLKPTGAEPSIPPKTPDTRNTHEATAARPTGP